jgi:DNA repair exonuclease SbcCD ATPase subunit
MNKIKIILIILYLFPLLLQAQIDIEELEYKLEGVGLIVTKNMDDLKKVIANENLSKQSLQKINKNINSIKTSIKDIAIIKKDISSLKTRIMKFESNNKTQKALLNQLSSKVNSLLLAPKVHNQFFPPAVPKKKALKFKDTKLEIYTPSSDNLKIQKIKADTTLSSLFVGINILNIREVPYLNSRHHDFVIKHLIVKD